MNNIRFFLLLIIAGIMSSCEVDNYEPPSAELHGSFIDQDTKEPVPSAIVNGTLIQLIEQGWVENQTNITQTLVVRNDGSYQNSMVFPGKYKIAVVNGNFQPIAPIELTEINGSTKLDFTVRPYLRVKDAAIAKNGSKVTATFKVEKTAADSLVNIGLFSHPNMSVSANVSVVSATQPVATATTAAKVHTLEIDLSNANFIAGRTYHFRIGALSSAPGAGYNYGPTIAITK
ncbi:DUF3823 domain-containing protein [Dyadobacter bucti]|uniref:DUF3823 domain-containing protein n=1 Tax=Dyadobacter bucti TaxID=2572203 RepID=UPI00140E552B|nr:DUF3823 domain-containing protein [Dyadobacter bucti]